MSKAWKILLEKQPVEVQNLRRITNHFREKVWNIPQINVESEHVTDRLNSQTLRSQPSIIMPKKSPPSRIVTSSHYAQQSPRTLICTNKYKGREREGDGTHRGPPVLLAGAAPGPPAGRLFCLFAP